MQTNLLYQCICAPVTPKNKENIMLCCFKILYNINHNKDNIFYYCGKDGTHTTHAEINNKYICIQMKDEQYYFNCNLCKGIACRITPNDQTYLNTLLFSYMYSKMKNLYFENNNKR